MTANQKANENLSFCHYLPDNAILLRKTHLFAYSEIFFQEKKYVQLEEKWDLVFM